MNGLTTVMEWFGLKCAVKDLFLTWDMCLRMARLQRGADTAALRFIPTNDLRSEGYGEYVYLFEKSGDEKSMSIDQKLDTATFAAGCFWGVQSILQSIPGVKKTVAGYMGGTTSNPVYKQVKTGTTGHAEVVQVTYDPSIITYEQLLDYFWRLHDPTTINRQGPDIGTQYRSGIFHHTEAQRKAAEESMKRFNSSGVFKEKAATEIVPASTFYEAEEYHQEYFSKNGGPVCHILRSK